MLFKWLPKHKQRMCIVTKAPHFLQYFCVNHWKLPSQMSASLTSNVCYWQADPASSTILGTSVQFFVITCKNLESFWSYLLNTLSTNNAISYKLSELYNNWYSSFRGCKRLLNSSNKRNQSKSYFNTNSNRTLLHTVLSKGAQTMS